MATLTVQRDHGYADKLRKYSIFLNGSVIGQLAEGAELHHELGEQPHTVEARLDWCRSKPFDLPDLDKHHIVVVRSALRGWRVMLALWYIIFDKQGYLTLELQPRSGL